MTPISKKILRTPVAVSVALAATATGPGPGPATAADFGSPAATVASCVFDACAGGACCPAAEAQRDACDRTFAANAAAAARMGAAGQAAQQATRECLRCSAVYLQTYCGRPRPEAAWTPAPVDYDALARNLGDLKVDPAVVSENSSIFGNGAWDGMAPSTSSQVIGFLTGFVSAVATGYAAARSGGAASSALPSASVAPCRSRTGHSSLTGPGSGPRVRENVEGRAGPGC
ncbi:MAG: hypothetical protein VYD87_06445 [Pseudomonadota bacterium]|nr:hypothetical protein [Pseudomonadota bacterium]